MSGIEAPSQAIERISLDKHDPAYRDDHSNFVVLLDGERVPFAITADKRTGEVLCTLTDGAGTPMHDGQRFTTCVKTGKVEIMSVDAYLSSI
jgi:hypothetical protein